MPVEATGSAKSNTRELPEHQFKFKISFSTPIIPPSAVMSRTIKSFTNDELNSAVHRVLQGDAPKDVCAETNICYRTLMKWVAADRNGIFEV